jgi:probable F420-dependent oxidoreductase
MHVTMAVNLIDRSRALTVGVTLPFNDHQASYADLLRTAQAVECAGFDSVWMADHLTGPTPSGARRWHDVVVLLANFAGLVPRITLGTDVLVAGHRHAVLTAKMLTTLDIVAAGRLIVGVGTGYIEKEFGEVGANFAKRGRMADEAIEVWKAVWSDGPTTFAGEWHTLTDACTEPKPLQRPGPPVWVGGISQPALRRAVRHADGWHPLGIGLDALKGSIDELHTLAETYGRTTPLTLSYSAGFGLVTPQPNPDKSRVLLTGAPDQVLADIAALRELGVTNIVLRPGMPSVSTDEVINSIQFAAKEVLPALQR